MLYLVTYYITMLRLCHKPYNGKNNASLTSNNQCFSCSATFVLGHVTGTAL